MTSPLPANAKELHHDGDDYLSTSFDRASSTARLSSSPVPQIYGTSPAAHSTVSIHTYSSDLDRVPSNTNGGGSLFRPLSSTTLSAMDLPEGEVAKAVKRHLTPVSSQHNGNYLTDDDSGSLSSVHQLPGGSITHGIYKWTENVENGRRKRTRSFNQPRSTPDDPALARLKAPGGFRRHFVVNRAAKQGKAPPHWMTGSFVDFLALYGHFGGEDLSDDEDEPDEDEEDMQGPDEETPLIPPEAQAPQGNASPSKAVFLLLKSFVGTGVMFLPKAFYNGGLIFSSTVMTFIAALSLYTFLLLVETRNKVPVSFGDIGGILFGPGMRLSVLFAITFSQIGFVCAYTVFVAQNLQALVESVSQCNLRVPLAYLIAVQVIMYVPLAMVRKIQKLSVFALIADVFILIGLAYLYYYDFLTLAIHGIGNVQWGINPVSFPMFIGTAVFTYEGVGLIIPITESMKDPKKFPRVLSWTMVGITFLFLSIGFLSYLAFGSEVQTVILLNLPATPVVDSIQGLYALAIMLSIPLQLFPAIRIIETGLFSRSGKHNPVVKWQKNTLRFATVLVCTGIAIAGSADLDKFVSLIGSLACIPLCYLFPPLFHLKGVAQTFWQKAIDIAIIVFGLISMIYTTSITVSQWSAGGEAPPISRCT